MDLPTFFAELAIFFDDQFLTIAAATAGLFTIMLIVWWIYKALSQRNLFILFTKDNPHPGLKDHFYYMLKYFFFFPLLIFIGFLIFSFSLFLLMRPTVEQQTSVLFLGIVLVSTIRVSAYVHESLAEDLAKLIPLSLLSVLLSHPSFSGFGITTDQIYMFVLMIPQFLKYLLFAIILEVLLRGGTWLFHNIGREEEPENA